MRTHLFAVNALWITLAVGGLVFAQDAKLSEVDQLKVQLHQAQIQLEQALATAGACRAQLRGAQLTEEQARMKADIEKRYPGFVFDAQGGQLAKKPEK